MQFQPTNEHLIATYESIISYLANIFKQYKSLVDLCFFQKNWLLNHIFVRHVPRAEIHLCLFVDCNLRFKKLKALTNHLNSAHVEQKRTKSTTENPENERKKFRSQKRCVLAGDEQLLMQNSDLNDNAGVPKRRGKIVDL